MTIAGLPVAGVVGQYRKDGMGRAKPVVALLEHLTSETNRASGASLMLKKAGFEVINLLPPHISGDISIRSMVMDYDSEELKKEISNRLKVPKYDFSVSPEVREVDMIFFGSFVNAGQPYHDFLRRYAARMPGFVRAGGIVVEMNQWARYSFLSQEYFPEGMYVTRETWSGSDELILTSKEHPFIKSWINADESLLRYPKQWHRPGRFYEAQRGWENIAEWKGLQMLVGAGGGYKRTKEVPGRAALLEAEYGKGRYLVSSLWLDKLYDEKGNPMADEKTMRVGQDFFNALFAYSGLVKSGKAAKVRPTEMAPEPIIGPCLGHIDHQRAIIWMRSDRPGTCSLRVWRDGDKPEQARRFAASASVESDFCVKWDIDKLDAGTRYHYEIIVNGQPSQTGATRGFNTAPHPDTPAKTILAFGSCVDQNGRFPELWKLIETCGAEGMVLLGDTPYIDSTVMAHQRIKHREFLSHEGPRYLSSKIPFWGTWDDHDFGANDSDGRLHNRKSSRKVFQEYRALPYFGEMDEGVYTSFRRGPLEVFILDIRYFSATEPSFAVAGKPSLIGRRQWEWLKKGLKASDAPFKILACGMTWDSKRTGSQTDDWYAYAYEREAIIDFIGQEKITGVMLVGGDIHCSQVMKFDTEKRIGYPLYHIVTSPMHNRVIREHEGLQRPGMLFARAEPNTFLKITANTLVEPKLLVAEIIDITGQAIYRLAAGDELGM